MKPISTIYYYWNEDQKEYKTRELTVGDQSYLNLYKTLGIEIKRGQTTIMTYKMVTCKGGWLEVFQGIT